MTSLTPHARRPRAVFVTVLMLVLAAVGVTAGWLAGRHHGQGPRSRIMITRTPPGTAPSLAGPSTMAGPPGLNLAGLRWTGFGGVELPVSPAAGPHVLRSGLASGFTDTPLGALLAAVNIAVRANAQWGPTVFVPTIRRQVTGPDAAALLAACQDTYRQGQATAGVPDGQPLGRVFVTEEAYRWDSYTAWDATVDVVSAGPGDHDATVRAATRIEVVWRRGDWRVVAPPGGEWGNAAAPVTSLAGYTLFPAPRP